MNNSKKLYMWLSVYLIATVYAYFTDNPAIKVGIFGLILYSTYLVKIIKPLYLYIGISILMNIESSAVILLLTIPLYLNKNTFRVLQNIGKSPIVYIILLLAFFSYLSGILPSINGSGGDVRG